ncbi:Monovalent cation/H+ antiporter subunit B [Wenzhouxiangella marina]|uniref:Monovalent cation/H+ antiporter subunit B n=1 Tax=Wenzhouxiangella marina TaxID=1579979 RepID=A0A0K0XT21_9GAMM|nr:Monovalent cation/H+ antiporter subunit B [Wenzhouxiangella marina]
MAVVRSRDLFTAAMLFAIYSLLSAALFTVLDAGDVALTEAAVGAGISTILVLALLALVPRQEAPPTRSNWPALAIVVITGAVLIYATADFPEFGRADNPIQTHVAPYYINETYNDMGVPNIVAAVLASYRSIDTLGEGFVILTAGLAVYSLLATRRRRPQRRKESRE